jgi:hypothetical protein
MAVTLGSLTISELQAQPFGYAEADTVNGLVARRWAVQGLVRPAQWLTLLNVFETWRNARKADPDSLVALNTGTTVAFSGSALGYSWTNVACWFTSAPAAEAAGGLVSVSFELVDATQQLAVLVRQQETEQETSEESTPDYGTITLGSATLTLTAQPEAYAEGPQLQRTAAGGLWINGPLGAVKAKQITGYTDAAGWVAVKAWYETTTLGTPIKGALYPSQPPSMTKEIVLTNGVKTTRHVVSLELWEA